MTLSAVLSVGSTEYSRLVLAALSEDGLGALAAAGVTRLFAQVGHSELPPHIPANETHERSFAQNSSMTIESICFDPDLDIRLAAADLVIAHAGPSHITFIISLLIPLLLRCRNRTCSNATRHDLTESQASDPCAQLKSYG